jgi:hypothetical protein
MARQHIWKKCHWPTFFGKVAVVDHACMTSRLTRGSLSLFLHHSRAMASQAQQKQQAVFFGPFDVTPQVRIFNYLNF